MDRGSEFRKWDLHIHSLYSQLNNQFGNSNEEQYLQTLKNNNIEAIGLTNYFSFTDADFKLQEYLENNGITTFLNLELRLSDINKDDQLFDYHIIFDNQLDSQVIKNVLGSLQANIGSVEKAFNLLNKTEIDQSANIGFDTLRKTLSNNADLKGHYLTGFLSRGHGSATSDSDPKNQAVFEMICNNSDLIIHSSCDNPKTCTDPHCTHNNLGTDRNYWLNNAKYVKPLLQSSDAHSLQDIGSKYSWIKADLTFNGLKQILFEPEDRICLNKSKPRLEKDELVIDKLIYNNQTIALSEGLNSIIGGRGNGKSTLLKSIAKSLMNKDVPESAYTLQPNTLFQVIWRDQTENSARDVEYIGQNFMFEMSNNPSTLKEMVQKIIVSRNFNAPIEKYDSDCNLLKAQIDDLLLEYFSNIKSENTFQKPEVEKDSAEQRLRQYETEREKILSSNSLTDSEKEKLQNQFSDKKNLETQLNYVENQKNILSETKIKYFNIEFNDDLSDEISNQLTTLENELNKYAKERIFSQSDTIKNELQNKIDSINTQITSITQSALFKQGEHISQNNDDLMRLNKLIEQTNQEIKDIDSYNKNLESLHTKREELKKKIISKYKEYEHLRDTLSKSFKVNEDNLEIKLVFTPKDFNQEFDFINGQGHLKNDFIIKLQENFDDVINDIFDYDNLKFNSGKTKADLIHHFFSTNFYEYSYDIIYQSDSFQNMSPGKKSFVILKLILDFSDRKIPVLIDQPEDSLDNRSIYNELTQYLRKTKKLRQIIVVTHNPNVVVGADSENVIIANKDSTQTPNANNKTFDYINGSLENNTTTKPTPFFLQSFSIQDHIFDILEGGKEAFKKREQKYIDNSIH